MITFADRILYHAVQIQYSMQHKGISIRPFIGAQDFEVSRSFYRDLGFEEKIITPDMSYFRSQGLGFYLQDAYVKEWVDNTMLFMEVEDVHRFWNELQTLNLPAKYNTVRLTPVRQLDWGSECFVHDPSGILWHFGEFVKTDKNHLRCQSISYRLQRGSRKFTAYGALSN
ncbi:MAG: glyoxalase [Chitinophagaceae bacterium]|nr:glyoxalase [Chitinophagaceae bacterium]